MERHAHYALVGVISTIVFIAAAAFVIWLGSLQINRKVDDYRILFRGPVRGLSEGGEVQFKAEKAGVVHAGVGKASFDAEKLAQNIRAFVDAVSKARPSGAKGTYMKKVSISSTMGPGVSVAVESANAE